MWCSKSPPSSKEVTEATDLGAMIQLLKDATDIECSIMGAVFGGGNNDMESHTRSCVDAIGSKKLRRWRVAAPDSAREDADNFASTSRGGIDTLLSCEAARSMYEEWTGLSRGTKPAAILFAGTASILPSPGLTPGPRRNASCRLFLQLQRYRHTKKALMEKTVKHHLPPELRS
jgi:hypothetical protein